MAEDFSTDIAAIGRIAAVPRILEVVCRATGLGFSAVARVTETHWVACAVRDEIAFGLQPGGELVIGTTICDAIRRSGELVVIENASTDELYKCHATPKMYGFSSYISVPIYLSNGAFFGTLCAIDPKPAQLKKTETVEMFKLFAELIGHHLDAQWRLQAAEAALLIERETAQLRDQFLATLAHELRNPLAPIQNGLTVLRLGRSDADRERTVGMMERQVGQLVHLIDDLMDVSRVSSGKVTLRSERIAVRAIFETAVETSRPLVEQAGHELKVELPAEPVLVEADPARLTQVVTNLLNNAAKYTPDGGRVVLSGAREGDQAVIRVTDNGVGVPAAVLPKIFDMFVQVGASLERSQGGLGLGLTLVRKLVELHGGTVAAESAGEGRGSTFTVRLPVAAERVPPARSQSNETERAVKSAGRRILVVDDNEDGADSMATLLEMSGHEVRTAYTGPDGLAVAKEFRPDVVLLDIGLPGMNGYEVAAHLRRDPDASPVVLVALTGWGTEDGRKRAADAGFDEHLTKPVESNRLNELLEKLPLGRSRP